MLKISICLSLAKIAVDRAENEPKERVMGRSWAVSKLRVLLSMSETEALLRSDGTAGRASSVRVAPARKGQMQPVPGRILASFRENWAKTKHSFGASFSAVSDFDDQGRIFRYFSRSTK